jgi:SNF2 family DNA or RNA helicase
VELSNWAPDLLGEIIGQVRKIDSSVSDPKRRYREIGAWFKRGGVLIMSYHIFRSLVLNKTTVLSLKKNEVLKDRLLNGPNIIVADEAHILKNTSAKISVATAQLRSRSRIALTGSPLANNLEEYHSMIDWTAPGYLGPLIEFRAKYVEPIQEGLYFDSSELERRQSLKMLQVLKRDLEPKVHRADISVLKDSLPPKIEFLIRVPLTEVQKGAYKRYVQSMPFGNNVDVGNASLWDWLVILSLLCNHPLCFKEKLLERDRKEPIQGNPTSINTGTSDEDQVEDGQVEAMPGDMPVAEIGITEAVIKQQIAILDQVGNDLNSIVHSHKAVIFAEILDASIKAGDKVLVFSHSLPTLNYLEGLLKKGGRRYSRLDGSTKMSDRQQATSDFNRSDTDVYLISTRAGGLGLNLYGANRVIIFDFKFNPTWEEQAVGRAYRIGQKKPVFVYHFISAGTFEEVVYNKAVFKMQLASRVVDKKNPTRCAMKTARDYLFEPKEVVLKDLSELKGKDPEVLDKVLNAHNRQVFFRSFTGGIAR